MRYIKNFLYIIQHKWYVLLETISYYKLIEDKTFARKLIKRAILHDMSKFSKYEFIAYANRFFNKKTTDNQKQIFQKAWVHHYTANDHHPEHWKGRNMDDVSIYEMVIDWCAMSRKFKDVPQVFYLTNKIHDKHIPQSTKIKVEKLLGVDRLNDTARHIINLKSDSECYKKILAHYKILNLENNFCSKIYKESYK